MTIYDVAIAFCGRFGGARRAVGLVWVWLCGARLHHRSVRLNVSLKHSAVTPRRGRLNRVLFNRCSQVADRLHRSQARSCRKTAPEGHRAARTARTASRWEPIYRFLRISRYQVAKYASSPATALAS